MKKLTLRFETLRVIADLRNVRGGMTPNSTIDTWTNPDPPQTSRFTHPCLKG
jgi:hypothetical protein